MNDKKNDKSLPTLIGECIGQLIAFFLVAYILLKAMGGTCYCFCPTCFFLLVLVRNNIYNKLFLQKTIKGEASACSLFLLRRCTNGTK